MDGPRTGRPVSVTTEENQLAVVQNPQKSP
jgi:hypothetical protein